MLRSSMSDSRKGQWFLISAILISSSLLSISIVFKDYFVVDSSDIARMNENAILYDVENQLRKITDGGYDQPDCIVLKGKIDEFKSFSESSFAERGYLLKINYAVDCQNKAVFFENTLVTDRMNVTKLFVP
ncbi:MAG: hypothetical protein HZB67_01320 [Candidatus Aenigmarchaeota archaeon]|nr:hypothetical protein [Candidatus Aenigmarchaeota archaeon]